MRFRDLFSALPSLRYAFFLVCVLVVVYVSVYFVVCLCVCDSKLGMLTSNVFQGVMVLAARLFGSMVGLTIPIWLVRDGVIAAFVMGVRYALSSSLALVSFLARL